MKKIVALACVAALALACIVGCSSASSKAKDLKYVGDWQVESVQVGGISADVTNVFDSFTLKLNSDSSYEFAYELKSSGESVSASGTPWESTSTGVAFGSGDEKVELTANDDKLSLNIGDVIKVNLVQK